MCESIILHHKIAQVTLDQAKYLLKIKEITEKFTEIWAPGTQPKRNNSRVQFWFRRAELNLSDRPSLQDSITPDDRDPFETGR
jgi:hypothetical protein